MSSSSPRLFGAVVGLLLCALPLTSYASVVKATVTGHTRPVKVIVMPHVTLLQATQYAAQHRAQFAAKQYLGRTRILPFYTRMSPSRFAAAKRAARSNGFAPRVSPNVMNGSVDSFTRDTGSLPATTLPVIGFDGLADSSFICQPLGCAPPDQGLAATPSGEIAEAVNGSVAMFNASSASEEPGWPVDVNSFFNGGPFSFVSGCNGGSYPFMADPRVFWDANTNRMWLSVVQFDGADFLGDSCPDKSWVWYAVSGGPTFDSGWYEYVVETDNGRGDLSDFPTLGYDTAQDTVASCFNDFSMVSGDFTGAGCLSLEKAGMEAGAGPTSSELIDDISCSGGPCGSGIPLDTIQPVQTKAGAGTGSADPGALFMLTTVNFFETNPDNRLLTIQCKTTGACITGASMAMTTIKNYTLAPDADVNIGPTGPCLACVETSDNRISATPQYSAAHKGSITFALETGVNNGSQTVPALEWGETRTAPGPVVTLRQNNYLVGSGDTSVSFGSIAEKNSGAFVVAYEIMGANINQGIQLAKHRLVDPLGTLGAGALCRKGVGPDIFDARWGDYSATAFDGTNIWEAGEYMAGSGDWSTAFCKRG
jgi:hypothetical protein